METIIDYVRPELLTLIPVLYLIGWGFKRAQAVPDRMIPLLLGGMGILLAMLWVFSDARTSGAQDVMRALFAALTQGVLCAGGSVYIHQLGRQYGKEE